MRLLPLLCLLGALVCAQEPNLTQEEAAADIEDLLDDRWGPEVVVRAIYEYGDFYFREGYSDGTIDDVFDELTTKGGQFAAKFAAWQAFAASEADQRFWPKRSGQD